MSRKLAGYFFIVTGMMNWQTDDGIVWSLDGQLRPFLHQLLPEGSDLNRWIGGLNSLLSLCVVGVGVALVLWPGRLAKPGIEVAKIISWEELSRLDREQLLALLEEHKATFDQAMWNVLPQMELDNYLRERAFGLLGGRLESWDDDTRKRMTSRGVTLHDRWAS